MGALISLCFACLSCFMFVRVYIVCLYICFSKYWCIHIWTSVIFVCACLYVCVCVPFLHRCPRACFFRTCVFGAWLVSTYSGLLGLSGLFLCTNAAYPCIHARFQVCGVFVRLRRDGVAAGFPVSQVSFYACGDARLSSSMTSA
jgi:hypothetical protein